VSLRAIARIVAVIARFKGSVGAWSRGGDMLGTRSPHDMTTLAADSGSSVPRQRW